MHLKQRLGLLFVVALLGAALSLISTATASAAVPSCGGCDGGGGGTSGGGGDDGGGGGTSGGGGGTPPPTPVSLSVFGSCTDVMTFTLTGLGSTNVTTISIPDANSTDVWSITATEQEFDAVTGAPFGDPFPVTKNEFVKPLAFNTAAGTGFTATADIENLSGKTTEISYTATRTSPVGQTCTNHGFWTDPTTGPGPAPQNPTGAPGIPG
jgi:hypothetical protein